MSRGTAEPDSPGRRAKQWRREKRFAIRNRPRVRFGPLSKRHWVTSTVARLDAWVARRRGCICLKPRTRFPALGAVAQWRVIARRVVAYLDSRTVPRSRLQAHGVLGRVGAGVCCRTLISRGTAGGNKVCRLSRAGWTWAGRASLRAWRWAEHDVDGGGSRYVQPHRAHRSGPSADCTTGVSRAGPFSRQRLVWQERQEAAHPLPHQRPHLALCSISWRRCRPADWRPS